METGTTGWIWESIGMDKWVHCKIDLTHAVEQPTKTGEKCSDTATFASDKNTSNTVSPLASKKQKRMVTKKKALDEWNLPAVLNPWCRKISIMALFRLFCRCTQANRPSLFKVWSVKQGQLEVKILGQFNSGKQVHGSTDGEQTCCELETGQD